MTPRALAAVMLLAATLAACGDAVDDGAAGTPSPTVTSSVPAPSPRDADPVPSDVVDAAVTDLADHLDVPPEEIAVASAQEVTWGDTSLGCPQPGQRYTQVVTEGVRIELVHDGTTFAYHAGGGRPGPFLCEDPQPPVGTATP